MIKSNKKSIYFHYGSPLNSSFMRKKSGLNTPTNIFYIDDGEKEILYVPLFEYDYFKKYSKHPCIKCINDISKFNSNYFISIIEFLKQSNMTVIISSLLPTWLFMKMLEKRINVEVDEFYFLKSLLYKNSDELKIIKKNANLTKICFEYIEDILASTVYKKKYIYYRDKKLSSKILSNIIKEFFIKRNLKVEFIVVACGKFSYYPHCQINHFLQPNKPIIIDLAVRDIDNGYYVDVSRTYFIIGKPECNKFINLYEDINNIKKKLEKSIYPGKLISKFYIEAVDLMIEKGIRIAKDNSCFVGNNLICHHSLGHGIGLDLHQPPLIDEKTNVIFENNMTIAIEPGAYLKNYGGVRIEDTYFVNENGVENLTAGGYKFLIKK